MFLPIEHSWTNREDFRSHRRGVIFAKLKPAVNDDVSWRFITIFAALNVGMQKANRRIVCARSFQTNDWPSFVWRRWICFLNERKYIIRYQWKYCVNDSEGIKQIFNYSNSCKTNYYGALMLRNNLRPVKLEKFFFLRGKFTCCW